MRKKTWTVKEFKDQFGVAETMRVMKYHHRSGVYAAIYTDRGFEIRQVSKDKYEVWQTRFKWDVDVNEGDK